MKKIKAEDLITRLANDRALIVLDVRDADEYAVGHVPGALNIPLAELGSRLSELPTGRTIITYCTPQTLSVMQHRGALRSLTRSERAAELLRDKGYDVRVLDGGLPAWQRADAAVLAHSAAGAMQHMNEDHRANMVDYARALVGLDWAEDAEMIALDRYGFDLHVTGKGKEATARITFDPPLTAPGQLRPAIVKLAQQARQRLQTKD
jgi:rhodanese-related sulfurtransferase